MKYQVRFGSQTDDFPKKNNIYNKYEIEYKIPNKDSVYAVFTAFYTVKRCDDSTLNEKM